jgi:hypothetical protein
MERFVLQYSQPLVDFLCKAKSQTEQDALDLVQSFWISKLLQPPPNENLVAKFLSTKDRPEMERSPSFRQYLLRSVSNQLLDSLRRKKRHGDQSLDDHEGLNVISRRDVDLFDNAWANRLLRIVVNNVRDECCRSNQMDMWDLFVRQIMLPRLTSSTPPGYAELAKELGFRNARSASNAVRTVVRKFQSHMKHCIADYLPLSSQAESDERISDEFDEMILVLSKPGALDHAMFDDLLQDRKVIPGTANTHVSHFSILSDALDDGFLVAPEKTLYASVADVECRWMQILESSIGLWLKSLGNSPELPSDVTFASLARGEFFTEQSIMDIRNVAKRAAREPDDEPVVLYGLIYLLSIAVGFEHHHRIFSSDTVPKIKKRMTQLLAQPWIDPSSKKTLWSFVDTQLED